MRSAGRAFGIEPRSRGDAERGGSSKARWVQGQGCGVYGVLACLWVEAAPPWAEFLVLPAGLTSM